MRISKVFRYSLLTLSLGLVLVLIAHGQTITPVLTIKDLELRRLKALSILQTTYNQRISAINKYYTLQENLLK